MFNLYYIQNASWECEVTVELFWSGFGFCGNSDFFLIGGSMENLSSGFCVV